MGLFNNGGNEEEYGFRDFYCDCEECMSDYDFDFFFEEEGNGNIVEYTEDPNAETKEELLQRVFEEIAYGECDTPEELYVILSEFFTDAVVMAIKEVYIADVENKMNALNQLKNI